MKKFIIPLIVILAGFFSSCSYEKKISIDCSSDWKIKEGSLINGWELTNFDDSQWNDCESLINTIHFSNDSQYIFVRKTIEIPQELRNGRVWLEIDRVTAAMEVYANGTYIGTVGRMKPDICIRTGRMSEILIPQNCITDNHTCIGLKIQGTAGNLKFVGVALDNEAQAYFTTHIHNIFSEKIFIFITIICLFIMAYSIFLFLGNTKDLTYLFFSLTLLFISFYFYDLGAENIFIPYTLHRVLARACLPVSLSFISLFLNSFFRGRKLKLMLIGAIIFDLFTFGIYLSSINSNDMQDLLFMIYLIPLVLVIIYGFAISIEAFRKKQEHALYMLIGLTVASLLSLYDVFYMVIGKIPFMWLQGIAFFIINLSIFLTLSIHSSKDQKKIVTLAEETAVQRDRLSEIFNTAKQMVKETTQIANELERSVEDVSEATFQSREKVAVINNALKEQTRIREETASAVKALTEFLCRMKDEFDISSASIEKSAQGTKQVMDGIETVSEGLSNAAKFTSSLSSITNMGNQDMKKLFELMKSIQNSSNEILSVVTTLDDFAQQTDLLSMNASIEAAHSGEAGKGFAVIAHEIKSLAAKSASWSAKIGEIITSVIHSIDGGVELTDKVNSTLDKIKSGATESAEKVSIAAEGMEEQREAGKAVSKESENLSVSAMRMKNEVSNQSSFASQVMGNMEELFRASAAVNEASSNISSHTEILSETVESLEALAQRTQDAAKKLEELMTQ
ncbi:MAG: hypothetical protein K6G00_07215 [Treponema sp.]|nr:hypothetical protein [Treponema sp.]